MFSLEYTVRYDDQMNRLREFMHIHDCEISIRNIIFAPRRDDITALEQFRQDI